MTGYDPLSEEHQAQYLEQGSARIKELTQAIDDSHTRAWDSKAVAASHMQRKHQRLAEQPPKSMSLKEREIVRGVAQSFDVSVDDILSGSQRHPLPAARALIARALRGRGYSTTRIGRLLGRHHSSVVAMLKSTRPINPPCLPPAVAPLPPIQGPWFVPDYSGEWAI